MMLTGVNWQTILREVNPAINGGGVLYVAQGETEGGIRADSESAMGALNGVQMNGAQMIVAKGISRRQSKHYTREQTFAEIATYLRTQYFNNPVRDTHDQIIGFENLEHLPENEKRALYENPYHTAYRYLIMRPNSLGDIESKYTMKVFKDRYGALHKTEYCPSSYYFPAEFRNYTYVGTEPIIQESDLDLIDHLWKAIETGDVPLAESDGIDKAKAQALFVKTLADLCRAHNWDGYQTVTKPDPKDKHRTIQVQENYDDKKLDNNSCGSGVTQRLVQVVTLAFDTAPENRELTGAIMERFFLEHMITSKTSGNSMFNVMDGMTLDELKAAREGLMNKFCLFDDVTDAQDAALKKLEWWTTADVMTFIQSAKEFFGPRRFTDHLVPKARRANMEFFDNYGMMTIDLITNALSDHCQNILSRLTTRIEELEQLEYERQEKERQERERQQTQRSQNTSLSPLEAISRQVQLALQMQSGAALASSSGLEIKPPILPGFELSRVGQQIAIEPRIAKIFKSNTGIELLDHVSRFPEAAQILNQYNLDLAEKLENAMHNHPDTFNKIRSYDILKLKQFLLVYALKHKHVIMLSEHSDLFRAITLSNVAAQKQLEALTYEQVQKLDEKLSQEVMSRYTQWKPEQQAHFIATFAKKCEIKSKETLRVKGKKK